MLEDAVDECENLEEASGYVENEPDNSLLKLSEEFFNCILKELMEEEVKQLLVENEDVSVKQFVVIEKDIIDFTPDEDVEQLTLNDVVNKSTASFCYSKSKCCRSDASRCDEQVFRQFFFTV